MKIFILLPAFNEELCLIKLIKNIDNVLKSANYKYEIIVCNDGSTDKTSLILEEAKQIYPIRVITHKINRGLGETSRDNFEMAAELSEKRDIIIRMDCDDTHEPKYFLQLIKKINEGYDVAIASRFAKGGDQKGVSKYRALISYCANIFMKLFFPIKGIREYSCGFRAYSSDIIKKAIKVYGDSFIQLRGLGFTCTLEKIIKLNLIGARFAEVPFVLRYDKKRGDSKMIGSITTLGYIVMVIMYYWPMGGWKNHYKKIN